MNKVQFKDLTFSQPLHQAIEEMGFVEATQIQSETIPLLLEGKDVIGQAQTGTGKTAAFGIPLLDKIEEGDTSLSSVILCPTRELAIQVANELKKIAKYKKHIHILPVYGGESIQYQIKDLKRHVQVIVGTPGRVMDHMDRKTLSFENVKTVVLDEADEMLNMGFRDDIEMILKTMPKERQTVLFSATMPKPIIELAKRYQHYPAHVKVTKENLTAASIEQMFFDIGSLSKIKLISTLIAVHDIKLSVIFCNTKRKVDEVTKALKSLGFKADGIHGDLDQRQRNRVLGGFRSGDSHILVATDVAARGIDVSDIDAVFNYDLPLDPEYYVHRIGRTGRAGKTGKAFSFVTGRNEFRLLKNIEQFASVRIERRAIPSDKEVRELNSQKLFAKIRMVVTSENISPFEEMVEQFTADGLTTRQLAAALLKIAMSEEKKIQTAESGTAGRFSEETSERRDHFHSDRSGNSDDRHERRFSQREHRREDRRRDDSHSHRTEKPRTHARIEHRSDEPREHKHPVREEHRKDTHPVTKRFVKRKIKKVIGY
ncbi:MAG: DEAD/DEAH box helicase [Bacteroidota bacterium]